MAKRTKILAFSTMILLVIFVCALAGPVPDTGQTTSYTDTFGEDSDYLINPPSYTKLDANGNDLADSATSWKMVRDNVTGLIWEVKTDDNSVHDKDNTYTWYDSNPDTNGGNAGTPGDGTDTEDFINELNSSNYGGHSDWRLPTPKELTSIVDYGKYNPAINTNYFPNMVSESSYYWSSTTFANYTDWAWRVNFDDGLVYGLYSKSNNYYVRAVRGGQSWSFGHLVINGDGTVTDTSTGLMWQQETAGSMTWEGAISYCENLSLSGYNDWYLPNRNELQSLVDYSKYKPSINTTHFPDTVSSDYWSSTTDACFLTEVAWRVNFDSGYVFFSNKSNTYYVRAIRGGQSWSFDNLVISVPEQGAIWGVGNQETITWDTKGITGEVKITLSREGGKGGTFETIVESTENDGNFAWTVTGPESVNCVLKIEPLNDTSNGTSQGLFSIVVDKTLPSAPSVTGITPTSNTEPTWAWNSGGGGNGSGTYQYKLDDSDLTTNVTEITSTSFTPETALADGPHTLYVQEQNDAGNWSSSGSFTIVVDTEPPATGSITISDNQGYTNQKKPTLQLFSEGVAYMRFSLSEEGLATATWFPFSETYNGFDISVEDEGAKTVWVEFKDLAGNIQKILASDSTVYDITPPVSQIDSEGGIYEEAIAVQLTSEEGAAIYYTVDGNVPMTSSTQYSNPVSISQDTTLKFFAADKAGNAEDIHTEKFFVSVLSGIEITSDTTIVNVYKGTIQFSATGIYENIDNNDISSLVSWICSNSDVATIDENGLLTAVKSGLYAIEISAKAGEIVSNKITVIINIPVALESIEILPDYLVLTAPGVTFDIIAIGYYSDKTTEDITIPAVLIPGDNSIISINTAGTVTATGYGTTTLTVTKDGIIAEIGVCVGDLDQTEVEEFIQQRGSLILVTGGGTDDALWPVSNFLSDYAYKVFISRGFTDDDIYFINPQTIHDYNSDGELDNIVDKSDPTLNGIQEAINTWAAQAETEGPLYLVLVDHGANQQFLVNTQGPSGILTAAQLNQWLDDFQTITGRQVVVIIEACQSGSFVDALKHTNRVIMASTETGQNSNLNNKFSFGKFFLSSIFKGTDLKNAYDIAGNKLKYLPAPWKNQVPQFDDMQDGDLAQSIFVGGNFKIASASPVISGEVTASVESDGKVTISTIVTDLEGLQDVWAIALPPDFTSQYDVVDFNTPDLTGLPTFDMTKEEGTDEYSVSTYSIAKAGDHKVIVYAMDTEGNIVNSEQKIVTITGANPTCQISLAEGWNLIGFCREPIDSSINVVLADIKDNIASTWKWVDGNWAVYLPNEFDEGASYASSKGFGQLTELGCGEGFWVNSSIAQALNVSGTQPSDTSCLLTEGWNLIGLKSSETKSITDLVSGNEGNIASVWKWKNNKWAVYLPGEDDGGDAYAQSKGFSVLGDINPGEGFWVNCMQAMELQ